MQQLKMDYRMKIQKINIPEGHRVIITSDIHGKLPYLKGLLEKLAFSKEDYLLIAGDIVEKGGESLATLRYLMELQKTFHVYAVYGNVDARAVEYLASPELLYHRYQSVMRTWGNSFYGEMLKESGLILPVSSNRSPQAIEMERMAKEREEAAKKMPEASEKVSSVYRAVSAKEALDCIRTQYEKELNFIKNLPVILDAGKFLVTHAGLPSENYENLQPEDVERMITWQNFQNEDMNFSRYVFVGHWPVTIYEREQMDSSPIINREKKIVSLDGGCAVKRDGQLNAVVINDINSEEFEVVSYDDFPRARVLEDQKVSEKALHDAFYVRWQDRHAELLEDNGEISLVRFLNSKEEHWIPNQYLWEEEDGLCCSDYTDYVMPLQAGEEVSVLGKYPNGYLVRKNGVLGWYNGRLKDY